MNSNTSFTSAQDGTILVFGATGKTGRRIASQLETKGIDVRRGSRSATPSFDWNNEAGWDDCLADVQAVYINYSPDLAMPGATDSIQAFVDRLAVAGRVAGGCVLGVLLGEHDLNDEIKHISTGVGHGNNSPFS